MTSRVRVTTERHFSAHHMLIGAARASLERVDEQRPGWFYDALASMVMSALAIEALCNAFGERVIEDWSDFENASPSAKIRILTKRLDIDFNWTKEPWGTLRWLMKFRNSIAHAKPQFLQLEEVMSAEKWERRQRVAPEAKLEKEITLGNAKRAVECAIGIKDLLSSKITPDEAYGLFADGWSGSADHCPDA